MGSGQVSAVSKILFNQMIKIQDRKEKNISATGFQDDTGFVHLSKEPWTPSQEQKTFPDRHNGFGIKIFFFSICEFIRSPRVLIRTNTFIACWDFP